MEDREENTGRSILASAGMFALGMSLGKSYYKKTFINTAFTPSRKTNMKDWAAIGAAFSAIPLLFSDDKSTNLITTGVLTFGSLYSKQLTGAIINSPELFNGLFVPMMTTAKKLSAKQNEIKEWAIESRQKILNERSKDKGYVEGIIEAVQDLNKAMSGKAYKKSKAYSFYKESGDQLDQLSFEDALRLGKKMPREFGDYVIARRKLENRIGNSKIGTNITSTLGYFSKIEKGKLTLDPIKFLSEDANDIKSKIDMLNTLPKYLIKDYSDNVDSEGFKEFNNYLVNNNMSFFAEALIDGRNLDRNLNSFNNNKVTYKQFMNKYNKNKALFKAMGSKANAYFDSEGNARYMNVLGNQVFSDNILINKKGSFFDATWLKPSNYVLDALKIVDSSFKPFFKTLPFGDNNQFPILDTLGIDTKIYNSIHGDKISKFYVNSNDNIDLQKTYDVLSRQINTMKNVTNDVWRQDKGYTSISDAFKQLNKLEDVYNPRIQTKAKVQEAIRLLEYKQTVVGDLLEKTGGTLKRSNLTGFQDDMDKAYDRYFVHIDNKKKLTLMKKTENRVNSVFYENKMYLRKNGAFEEQKGEYLFDLSKQTRIIQAKRNKSYYTTQANREGRYVEEEDAPINFNFDDFKNIYENKGSKEAFNYMKKSDINFIPKFGRNGYKDSDNFYDNIREPYDRIKNYLLTTKKKDRNFLEMAGMTLGITKQTKGFYDKYAEEVEISFNRIIEKYNSGMQELSEMIKSNNAFKNRYFKATGKDNLYGIKNNLSFLTTSKINNITGNSELSNNISNALNIKKAFEISSDKYNLTNEYKSLLDIGPKDIVVKKKLGELFNVHNFKEDIIINTFNQHNSYKEFKNNYGDLFEENIMFGKENLFNKNRITNINLKSPSIVQKVFSDVDKNTTSKELLEGKNKIGTNLGMFVTKGFESFENSLSILGIPKLNPDNMKSTTEYIGALIQKRIAPMIGTYMAYSTINSFVDMVLPDDVPIFGEGLTAASFRAIAAARMATQIAINSIGMGYVFRKLEEMFPGMLTDNGLLSPLQLSYTNEEMYDILYNGKEVEDRKNRFWFSSGRQKFEGGEIQALRPSLLFLGQHRTAGIYENKVQRFFRNDFLPTKLLWTVIDPYMEERINKDKRPVAKSGDLFNSELPVIGGYINLLGKIIKPNKYYNEEQWKIADGIMLNPEYNGQENTPQFIYYDTSWKLTQATFKAYEDIKSMMGMRGYIIGQAISTVFGTDNPIENNNRLETLNDGQNAIDRFNALNLGGMFGTTEPIRRLLGNKPIESTVSPIRNNYMPDWMPQSYFKNVSFGNVYNEIPFGEFILPGEVYEQYNKLHSDDTGKYGVVDRLKILSKVAPYSKEFRHTRSLALKRIKDMSSEEKQIVYQSLSYAEKWRQRDVNVNHRQEYDVENTNVTIKRMEGLTEFYGTDNKRYKIVGINADYLSGRSSSNITEQMESLQNNLVKGNTLKGIIASDPIKSVKTDNSGEYIELYVPEFDRYDELIQETYLRHSYKSDVDITDYIMNSFKNAKKPGYLEKIWGSKDAYHRYYYENILDPTFKNWETPIASFINPILDTASVSTKGYIGSMNIALRVGEFGDPVLPLMTTMSYAKGMVFGANTVDRIEREDELKNMIEYAKSQLPQDTYRGNFNSSIYNMSENDGLSKMKNYLTMTERKYLDDLVNEVNDKDREKIYEVSSDRMKKVLSTLWKRQAEYNGGTYEAKEIELPDMSEMELPEYNATNDTSYNDALFKLENGFDLTSYEQKNVNLFGTKHLKEYKRDSDIAEYIDNMLKNKAKHKVLSTTMNGDMIVYKENDR